jgi:hypothetical protein
MLWALGRKPRTQQAQEGSVCRTQTGTDSEQGPDSTRPALVGGQACIRDQLARAAAPPPHHPAPNLRATHPALDGGLETQAADSSDFPGCVRVYECEDTHTYVLF